MTRTLRRVLAVMLVGVVLYGLFVLYAGYREIGASLARYRWWTFAAALGLATVNYGFRFLKWEYYLGLLGVRGVRKPDSLLVFLSGFVLTVTPGKVGEVFKSAVLSQTHGVPAARTAPIVVAERLTDVIAIIILIVIGSAGFAGGLHWAVVGTGFVLLGLTFILWRAPGQWALRWLERGPRRQRFAPKLAEALESLRLLARPSSLLVPTALSVVGWGCEGVAMYVILTGFDSGAPFAVAVFFYATATLAGAIVPLPGGLGVTETIMQEGLVLLGGVAQGPATASMILTRFATLWWAVVVGFVALAVLKARFPGFLRDQALPEQARRPTQATDEPGQPIG